MESRLPPDVAVVVVEVAPLAPPVLPLRRVLESALPVVVAAVVAGVVVEPR